MKDAANARLSWITDWLQKPVSIAPLISFRLVFGAVMVFSCLRFWYLGWIEEHFIDTQFTFKFFGFEWVQLLSPEGMYTLHVLMLLGAIGVFLGAFYRLSAILFFISFTYTWLIDLTYYLNHYYFVSLAAFLLIFVPAHRRFSIDTWRNTNLYQKQTAHWAILIFKWQIAIVYIYAGLAKINYDWLIAALPLKIWVPANDRLPIIGSLFSWEYAPWLFSWVGMLYDATIVFWLSWKRTRLLAYISVIIFHGLTGMMFQIGVFPLVMIGATWIFFSENFHERLITSLEKFGGATSSPHPDFSPLGFIRDDHHVERMIITTSPFAPRGKGPQDKGGFTTSPFAQWVPFLLSFYFAFQLLFPCRYLIYPGNLFWTEQGYRFSWRVMLMEKAGTATFYVKDEATAREGMVFNEEFLSDHQEKQMAMQPDMILQYAQFLKRYYETQGVTNPSVRAEVYVTLNARPSQLLFDPNLDLTKLRDSWKHKDWIFPFRKTKIDEK